MGKCWCFGWLWLLTPGGGSWREVVALMEFHCSHTTKTISMCVSSREEKLRYVTMVAKVLELNEPWSCKYGRKKTKKLTRTTLFLSMIALRNKTVAHAFLPSFDDANNRLCQERLLWSRNFATMVMWRHTFPFYTWIKKRNIPRQLFPEAHQMIGQPALQR